MARKSYLARVNRVLDSLDDDGLEGLALEVGTTPQALRLLKGKTMQVQTSDLGRETVRRPVVDPVKGVGGAAILTITAAREGALIAAALPYPIFGALDNAGDFQALLRPYLPAGVSVEVTRNADGSLTFEYTLEGDTDEITVSCQETDYRILLSSLLTDVIDIGAMKLFLSDPAQLIQYTQQYVPTQNTVFGYNSANPFSPQTFRNEDQFQADILTIPMSTTVRKENAIIGRVIAVDGFSIAHTFMLNAFSRM